MSFLDKLKEDPNFIPSHLAPWERIVAEDLAHGANYAQSYQGLDTSPTDPLFIRARTIRLDNNYGVGIDPPKSVGRVIEILQQARIGQKWNLDAVSSVFGDAQVYERDHGQPITTISYTILTALDILEARRLGYEQVEPLDSHSQAIRYRVTIHESVISSVFQEVQEHLAQGDCISTKLTEEFLIE